MKWNELVHVNQLDTLLKESINKPVLIFKHSTRCSISRATLDRLERNWNNEEMAMVKPYFLDLISYRDISNKIADEFEIEHESPQVIILKNGKAVYDSSHMAINYATLKGILLN